MELEFRNEHLDCHHEQHDFRLCAYRDGNSVGHVDYSTFQGKVNVSFIKSYILREGIGTAMLKELQRKYPKTAINFGFLTDEGDHLLKSLDWNTERNHFFDVLVKTKSRLRTKIAEIENLWKKSETLTGQEKQAALKHIETLCWNETSDALDAIEQRLSREPEFFRYIDTEEKNKRQPRPQ